MIKYLKLALALTICFWFSIGFEQNQIFAGVVHHAPETHEISFIETLSVGKNRVCSYIGSVQVDADSLQRFNTDLDRRQHVDARKSLLDRWELIQTSKNLKIFGPTNPADLFSDLVDQTVTIKESKVIGSFLFGLGASIQYLALQFFLIYDEFTMEMINQAEKLLLTKVAWDEAGATLKSKLFEDSFRKGGAFSSKARPKNIKGYEQLADYLKNLIRDQKVIEFKLLKKAIQHSPRIGSTGMLISFIGFTLSGVTRQIYTNHEIRSILSNSILRESDLEHYHILANMIAQMPEDVSTQCPSVSENLAAFKSGDFSGYQYDKFDLPSQKKNFKVIIDDVLRTLIQIN